MLQWPTRQSSGIWSGFVVSLVEKVKKIVISFPNYWLALHYPVIYSCLCCLKNAILIGWLQAAEFFALPIAAATLLLMFSDKPRFPKNHTRKEYIWAGKTRNVTCTPLSEPAPTFAWQRNRQNLRPNGTFHIFSSGKTSRLQVHRPGKVLDNVQTAVFTSAKSAQ